MKKICEFCGNEYDIPKWRYEKSRYCSRTCKDNSSKAKNNVVCAICGKPFHLKQSHIDRFKGDIGFCCSRECNKEQMRRRMSGEKNHQYGLKGELNASFKHGLTKRRNNSCSEYLYYVGEWYAKRHSGGRITYHRFLVELHHSLFDDKFFEEIDGWFYLIDGYEVHHIDLNHNNNDLSNLQVLSKSEHVRLHNLIRPMKRDKSNGQFIKDK